MTPADVLLEMTTQFYTSLTFIKFHHQMTQRHKPYCCLYFSSLINQNPLFSSPCFVSAFLREGVIISLLSSSSSIFFTPLNLDSFTIWPSPRPSSLLCGRNSESLIVYYHDVIYEKSGSVAVLQLASVTTINPETIML